MSLNDIEFISPENVVIKTEYIKEDSYAREDTGYPYNYDVDSNKCGEVFTTNNVDFVLCCAYCQSTFNNLVQFGEHLRFQHSNPFEHFLCNEIEEIGIDSDNDLDTPLEVNEVENENESSYIDSNSEEVVQREARFACEKCKKRYKYKLNFERHKCPAAEVNQIAIPSEPVVSVPGLEHINLKLEKDDVIPTAIQSTPTDFLHMNLKNENSDQKFENRFPTTCHICGQISSGGQHLCYPGKIEAGALINPEDGVPNPDLFCDICHRQFKYKNVFRRHGMQHEIGPLALRRDPNYRKCVECCIEFSNNADWLAHEMNHPNVKPFQCTFCQKKFKTSIELDAHSKNHTVEGPVKCDQCGADFVRYKNLISHVNRVHLQLRPYACTLCDKRFPQNAELKVHMRRHTGEKPYQCEECGQSFMVATKLNEHLKRHAGVRDVQCPVCPMAFVTKKMLRKHMVKHSTERPHICATCGNTFSRRKALLAHVKIHLDIKEYVCNLCGKAFAQHAGLYMHKKTHLNE